MEGTGFDRFFTEDGEIDIALLFMYTFSKNDNFETYASMTQSELADPQCYTYSDDEVFQYNYSYFAIGFFFLGLQYTHLDFGPFQRFTLVPSIMKTWGWFLWSFFILWVIVIFKVLIDCVGAYRQAGCLVEYLIFAGAILGFTYWNTKRLEPDYQLHVHHYVIGCFIMAIICNQSPFISFFYGFMNGMAVEGGCRWGFDPIWEKKATDPSPAEEDVTKEDWFYTETYRHNAAQRALWVLVKDTQSKTRLKNFEVSQN